MAQNSPRGRSLPAGTILVAPGAVAGALCLAPLASHLGRGRVLGWSLALLPPALAVYSASQVPWQGAVALFVVGLIYICVLSGLSTVVQLRAPEAYRGRILSFFLVALGVAYPVGSLVQGPVIDRVGVGPTTAGTALLLLLIMAVTALRRPGFVRSITGAADRDPAAPAPRAIPADTADPVACGGCDEPSARR